MNCYSVLRVENKIKNKIPVASLFCQKFQQVIYTLLWGTKYTCIILVDAFFFQGIVEHVAARLFHSVPYLFGHTARFLWFKNICPCHCPSKFMLLIAQIYFKTSSNAHMWLNGCHLSQVIPSNSRAGLVLDFKTLRMTLGLFTMSLLLASAQYRSWYGESTIHKYTIWPYFRKKKKLNITLTVVCGFSNVSRRHQNLFMTSLFVLLLLPMNDWLVEWL